MPIRIRASDELSLIVAIFEGVIAGEEFETKVAPVIAQPKYATMRLSLADLTGALIGDAPSETIRRQARNSSFHVDGNIKGTARLAIAAPSDELFGLGRMYEMLRGGSPVDVAVFRTLSEAESWLELPDDYKAQLADID
jgi:hypothetical protein